MQVPLVVAVVACSVLVASASLVSRNPRPVRFASDHGGEPLRRAESYVVPHEHRCHATTKPTGVSAGNCITCNNSETCCDGSSCCHGGKFCCERDNDCCQDTCCSSVNETCCNDPVNGAVCCEAEWSFCCKPQPEYDLPSRCCPRWFVCCDLGEYGCCNPDSGQPLTSAHLYGQGSHVHDASVPLSADDRTEVARGRGRSSATEARCGQESARRSSSDPPSGVVAYALMLEPSWLDGSMNFDALAINVTSGAQLNSTKIHGFKTGGEEQRQFMFDRSRKVFYLLQADFDHDGHNGLELPIVLWTINPVDGGSVSKCPVVNATNLVTGYRLLSGVANTIVFATYWLEPGPGPDASSSTGSSSAQSQSSSGEPLPFKAGYKFYRMDVNSCVAEEVAQIRNPTLPHFVDTYAGWFHDASPDGTVLYRLGYENVVTSDNWGLGATTIASPNATGVFNATTEWKSIPRPDGTHENYVSLNMFPAAPAAAAIQPNAVSPPDSVWDVWFVSMAPTNNVTEEGDLSLYLWSPFNPYDNVTKLAKFPNAHLYPALSFGPISECLSSDGSQYAAVVVLDSPLGDMFDTTAMVFVNGIAGPHGQEPSLVVENALQPVLLAETDSPAGVGIPDQ